MKLTASVKTGLGSWTLSNSRASVRGVCSVALHYLEILDGRQRCVSSLKADILACETRSSVWSGCTRIVSVIFVWATIKINGNETIFQDGPRMLHLRNILAALWIHVLRAYARSNKQ